jgi:hypothetical protein
MPFVGPWSSFHRRIIRAVVSLALVATATLVLVPSILANWTRTQLYDTDTFADSAVVALDEDVVRAALIQAIVDEIIRTGSPEAISVRPLVEFVTATVVDTQAFRDIYRNAVEELHRDMFQKGNDAEPVALTLVDALIVISAYIQQAYPEVAGQLPPNLGNAFIEIRGRDWAVEVVAYGEDAAYLSVLLPFAMLALYGVALLLTPDRRQVIAAMGIGWIVVAVLIVVGRDYAREFVLPQGFATRAVSEAIWDVYTRSLLGWSALVGFVGLMITVAGTGAHRANPAQQLDWVRRAVSRIPESLLARIVRASVFVAAGLLVISQRDQLLILSVLLGGAYLMYYGLTELVWLVGHVPVNEPAPRRARVFSLRLLALRAGSVAVLILAGIGGFFYVSRAVETAGGAAIPQSQVTRCNGHEELCDKRLNQLVFLGTHNSMAAASEPGWYFPNQLTGIQEQLEAGVRVLLLDTYYGIDTGRGVRTADRDIITEAFPPGEFSEPVIEAARRLATTIGSPDAGGPRGTYLCHGFCELGATPLTQALSEIDQFLTGNPGEVVILLLQDQISPEDTAKAFIASGLVKRVYQPDVTGALPTLRELIERDQRVLVFADNESSGVDWYIQADDFIQDTPFRVTAPEDFSCEPGRGESTNPLFALNHWLTTSFPSTSLARQVNSFDFLYQRVVSCQAQRLRKVNMIIVNFYEVGDAGQVVDRLNGVAASTASTTP